MLSHVYNCGIAGENRRTGAKFPMEIIDLYALKERILLLVILVV